MCRRPLDAMLIRGSRIIKNSVIEYEIIAVVRNHHAEKEEGRYKMHHKKHFANIFFIFRLGAAADCVASLGLHQQKTRQQLNVHVQLWSLFEFVF